MRRPIIAGNWKMHTTYEEAQRLAGQLLPALAAYGQVERVLIPPFPWIVPLADLVAGRGLELGAQNCAIEDEGAFTGEVSARMIAPFCTYVIVGHSERRHILGETDQVVAGKLRAVLRNGLRPILCVGELLEEREQGAAEAVVERQLRSALVSLAAEDIERTIIAYEPVWAIGTGHAATPDDAQAMAKWVRAVLTELAGATTARRVRIQYGGSVNADNAAGFLALDDIDGALVGGASLKADQFTAIVAAAAETTL